jgi:hypothetical protein
MHDQRCGGSLHSYVAGVLCTSCGAGVRCTRCVARVFCCGVNHTNFAAGARCINGAEELTAHTAPRGSPHMQRCGGSLHELHSAGAAGFTAPSEPKDSLNELLRGSSLHELCCVCSPHEVSCGGSLHELRYWSSLRRGLTARAMLLGENQGPASFQSTEPPEQVRAEVTSKDSALDSRKWRQCPCGENT